MSRFDSSRFNSIWVNSSRFESIQVDSRRFTSIQVNLNVSKHVWTCMIGSKWHVFNLIIAIKQLFKPRKTICEVKKSFFLFYYFIHLYFRTDFFDLRRLWKRQENYIDNNKHETNYLTRVPISQFFLTNNGREYTFPFLHSFGKTKKH